MVACRCKVRMSGLCKVEMSVFLRAGGPDGRGADRVGTRRARSAEGIARSGAGAFEAAGSRGAVAAQRAADSALAAASKAARRPRSAAWMAWAKLESEILAAIRTARGAAGAAAV